MRPTRSRLRESGIATTVLAPTAEDLSAIRINAKRVPVLDTALRTTAAQLQGEPFEALPS